MVIKSGSNNQVAYKRNEVDVFKGRALLDCEGFQLKQLKKFKIRNLHIGGQPDGWQGDYIDIGLTNGTRFCDIELRPGICVPSKNGPLHNFCAAMKTEKLFSLVW